MRPPDGSPARHACHAPSSYLFDLPPNPCPPSAAKGSTTLKHLRTEKVKRISTLTSTLALALVLVLALALTLTLFLTLILTLALPLT